MDLLTIAAVIVSAALAGSGCGGAGLLIVYLTSYRSVPLETAQRMNLVYFICASLAALPYHMRRRKIIPAAVIIACAAGALGSAAGGAIRSICNTDIAERIFGAVLLAGGFASLVSSFAPARRKKAHLRQGGGQV